MIQTVADVHATMNDRCNLKDSIVSQEINHYNPMDLAKTDKIVHSERYKTQKTMQHMKPNKMIDIALDTKPVMTLNAEAPAFTPHKTPDVSTSTNVNNITMCDEFSRFLIQKELVLSRLTKYDDQPDMYVAWKTMFQNVVTELRINTAEEVDLLVKWLGPTSSKQALRIRSSNADNPQKCHDRIWERLEDRFGRPEMVEETMKRKIASFPKITTKDYRPLFDLSDIVEEINAIMSSERYYPVFAHFNSSSGVNQIMSKLPHNLQEKWTQTANNYKIRHSVMYLPFSIFAKFIADMAKLRNDPSFNYENSGEAYSQQKPRRTEPVHVSTR